MIEGITKAPRRSLYYNSMLTNLLQWKDDNHPRRQEYENIVSMATANMYLSTMCYVASSSTLGRT